MTDSKYAPTVWGVETFSDLTMPSGQLCQVRQPGVQAMIASGVLEAADTLSTLVDEKHIKRVAGKAPNLAKDIDAQSLLSDTDNMTRVFNVVDKVTAYIVVQPSVIRPIRTIPDENRPGEVIELPLSPGERVTGQIYTDMVEIQDKMYLFQYAVGGNTDLERFRQQFDSNVGSLATLEAMESSTE